MYVKGGGTEIEPSSPHLSCDDHNFCALGRSHDREGILCTLPRHLQPRSSHLQLAREVHLLTWKEKRTERWHKRQHRIFKRTATLPQGWCYSNFCYSDLSFSFFCISSRVESKRLGITISNQQKRTHGGERLRPVEVQYVAGSSYQRPRKQ